MSRIAMLSATIPLTLLFVLSWSSVSTAQGLSRTQTPPQYTTTPSRYTTTPPEYIPLPDTVPANGGQQNPGQGNPGQGNQGGFGFDIPDPTVPDPDPTVPGDDGDDLDNPSQPLEDDPIDTPDETETPNSVEQTVRSYGQYFLGLDDTESEQFVTDFGTLAGQMGFQTEEVDFQTGVRIVAYMTLSRLLGLDSLGFGMF